MYQWDNNKIIPAQVAHLPQIVALSEKYQLKNRDSQSAHEEGFLVSDFTEEKYKGFIDRADYFLVIQTKNDFAGFMLAYSSDRIKKDEWLNGQIKSKYPEPFVLIKQVCINSAHSG